MGTRKGVYGQIVEHIFHKHYRPGDTEVEFDRPEMLVKVPKNLGDVVYTYRYRSDMPGSVAAISPAGQAWLIRGRGIAKYAFVAVDEALLANIRPTPGHAVVKVPDAIPGIIAQHVQTSEQALLAKVRYNRLIDLFTGVVCHSLQSHWRTTVGQGQIETDEVYLGVDRYGTQYVIPVEAKGGNDAQSVVQMDQDLALCKDKFPDLVPLLVATQFTGRGSTQKVVMFLLTEDPVHGWPQVVSEAHYQLVAADAITPAELTAYRQQSLRAR